MNIAQRSNKSSFDEVSIHQEKSRAIFADNRSVEEFLGS